MIPVPRMLMIGSTGRNSGKTTFAIEGIRRWKEKYPVIALKVTSMEELNGNCPRGGHGCNGCSNLGANYELIEELDPNTAKDTSQLLKNGASRVFWLRSLRTHLSQSMEDFLKLVPSNAVIICESNSLRKVVEPGAFIILNNTKNGLMKITAQNVLEYADLVIDKDIRLHANEVLDEISVDDKNGEISIRPA